MYIKCLALLEVSNCDPLLSYWFGKERKVGDLSKLSLSKELRQPRCNKDYFISRKHIVVNRADHLSSFYLARLNRKLALCQLTSV
ncbi:hypothetical protein Plhal304r1_c010g0038151 [Plasmopara halstedii]